MDYRYLKAFILTAQFSSFSKAADALKIAQSAVSRQIKLLEESLGEELIIRSSKKVLLTNRGRELFLAAQQFDKFAADIFQKEDSRPIRIGILHGLLKTWFTPILSRYLKKTERSIYMKIEDHPDLKKGIEDGKFDIIFTTENIQSELISSLKLFDEKMVLISKSELNKKKLHEYRWIAYSENDMLYQLSKKPSPSIVEIDSIETIMDLVRAGVGIATVPDHVLKKNDNLNIYDLPTLPKSEIYMTTLNYKVMPTHIKEIADMLHS